MALRELVGAQLVVARAVRAVLPGGDVVVGCSGGADSMALALGAQWAARFTGTRLRCVVVDHGLQEGSDAVARRTVAELERRGLAAESRRVEVDDNGQGMEAAAREARLACLAADGSPVLLGHTLDDQAETVLLGLLRGSGTRSLAGMAAHRPPFLRPLLGVRRDDTLEACRLWGVEPWFDPHNRDRRFARVRARDALELLSETLARDVAPALARSATLARADADALDDIAAGLMATDGDALAVAELATLPDALRTRVLRAWLGPETTSDHVAAVDALVTRWHGQGAVALPGAEVAREGAVLRRRAR